MDCCKVVEVIEVASITEECERVHVVTAGVRGPPGPPGSGSGSGSGAPLSEFSAVADGGAQTVTIPAPIVAGSVWVFINGLRQSFAAFSVAGSVVTLPADLNLVAGDVVSILYSEA